VAVQGLEQQVNKVDVQALLVLHLHIVLLVVAAAVEITAAKELVLLEVQAAAVLVM
jgi:hypothetical protein